MNFNDKEIQIPDRWGLCMAGNEIAFAECLIQAASQAPAHFHYLEIGAGGGQTLRAACELMDQVTSARWSALGVDIPQGWSFSQDSIQQELGERIYPPLLKIAAEHTRYFKKLGKVFISLLGSRSVCVQCRERVNLVFIDGCHGAPCVKADFYGACRLLAPGGVVIFHDASPKCQGLHKQPHCGTGIAVRSALMDMGLLGTSVQGWRCLCDLQAVDHGIAAFQLEAT